MPVLLKSYKKGCLSVTSQTDPSFILFITTVGGISFYARENTNRSAAETKIGQIDPVQIGGMYELVTSWTLTNDPLPNGRAIILSDGTDSIVNDLFWGAYDRT